MNPCPCGFLGEPSGNCRCAPPEIARYRARISGPLLDRIDLRVTVPTLNSAELFDDAPEPNARLTSELAAAQVCTARARQFERAGALNADLAVRELQVHCVLDRHCRALLAHAREKLELSARSVHRVLRVARTIADLGAPGIQAPSPILAAHLAEALQLRRAIS